VGLYGLRAYVLPNARGLRHWAQIATLLRLHGVADAFHNFLFSPVLGGEFRRAQDKA
jgi:hypothetical protein